MNKNRLIVMTIIKKRNECGNIICDVPECKKVEIITQNGNKWIYPEDWLQLYLFGILKNLCPKCCCVLFDFLNGNKK